MSRICGFALAGLLTLAGVPALADPPVALPSPAPVTMPAPAPPWLPAVRGPIVLLALLLLAAALGLELRRRWPPRTP